MGGLPAQALLAAACLCIVLLLILGAARAARAVPALRAMGRDSGGLILCGSLVLDRQRHLHLVELGDLRALVLTGGGSDVMISLPAKP